MYLSIHLKKLAECLPSCTRSSGPEDEHAEAVCRGMSLQLELGIKEKAPEPCDMQGGQGRWDICGLVARAPPVSQDILNTGERLRVGQSL